MSSAETVWTIVPLVAALAALLLFVRKRRTTVDYAETRAFKAALPWWVGSIERLVALAWAYLLAVATWKIYVVLLGHSRSTASFSTAGKLYVVLGIVAIVLPLALLCATGASGLISPLGAARDRAF